MTEWLGPWWHWMTEPRLSVVALIFFGVGLGIGELVIDGIRWIWKHRDRVRGGQEMGEGVR